MCFCASKCSHLVKDYNTHHVHTQHTHASAFTIRCPAYCSTEARQTPSVPEITPSAKTSAVSLSHPLRPHVWSQPFSAAALVSTPLYTHLVPTKSLVLY